MNETNRHDDAVNRILYPKKFPLSMLFDGISCAEYMLITTFIRYEEENNGRHITINELANELDVSVPAVSKMLKNLESRNLVERQQDKLCRRNTFVRITDEGKDMFDKNNKKMHLLTRKILDNFTEEEIELVNSIHDKVADVIEEELNNQQFTIKERVG